MQTPESRARKKISADNNNFDTANDKTGVFAKNSVNTASENEYFKAVWESDFASSYPFAGTNDVLMLFSAGKTAYEATTGTITLKANSSALYSVWVKTSKIPSGATGAGISYTETDAAGNAKSEDDEKTALLSSIDSTAGTKTEVDDTAGGKKENIFGGWQQCTLLFENDTENDKYFTLTFTYGATADDAEKTAYGAGYAAFTNLEAIGSNLIAETRIRSRRATTSPRARTRRKRRFPTARRARASRRSIPERTAPTTRKRASKTALPTSPTTRAYGAAAATLLPRPIRMRITASTTTPTPGL